MARKQPDAIEVEAEVVEDGLLAPRPVYVPAVIDAKAYLEYTAANVERLMEPYSGMTDEALAQMDPKEVKACRADVNRIIKEVEDQRKQIKAAYNGPLKAFEEAVALILEPAKAASDQLKAAVDANADKVRTMRREGLEATYMDFAPALAEVVPFERILQINPKWLNASYGAGKAAQELEEAVGKIAKDWASLQAQADTLPFYQEAEAEFFRTLDVGAALAYSTRRAEEQERIDAMKAEVEANRAAQQIVQPEEPAELPPEFPCDRRRPWVIRISMSDFEKKRLVDFIQAEGIGADRFIGLAKEE